MSTIATAYSIECIIVFIIIIVILIVLQYKAYREVKGNFAMMDISSVLWLGIIIIGIVSAL